MPALRERLHSIEEIIFSFFVPIDDRLPWVLRKLCVLDNELVQVVAEEVRTGISSVAIENTKEAALRPILDILLRRWLHDVEHNADPVLVVVPYDALIRVGRVPHDETVLAHTALGRLPARQVQGPWVGRRTVTQQELLDVQRLVVFHLTWRPLRPIRMVLDHRRAL